MSLLWRSLIYVPAHVDKFVNSDRIGAADGIILDLEDSVPAETKTVARAGLGKAVETLTSSGSDILVRINEGALRAEDIAAAVRPGVKALVIPKVTSADDLRAVDQLITAAESAQGLEPRSVGILVLIETASAYLNMADIAGASARVLALNLGAEDLALDVGMECADDTLAMPRQQMAFVAASVGVLPLGLMGPTTRFDDLEAYRALAERSRRFGYVGASCIHPSQIAILNAAFSPDAQAIEWAQRVIEAAAQASAAGRGAVALEGRMIDAPIVARARAVLARRALTEIRDSQKPAKATASGQA